MITSVREKNMERMINGKDASEYSCCGVFALAYITGDSCQKVWDSIKDVERKAAAWKGSLDVSQIKNAAINRGIQLERLDSSVSRFKKVKDLDQLNLGDDQYFVTTRDHCFIYSNGLMIDQTQEVALENAYGNRQKIQNIYAIKSVMKAAA